MSTIASQELTLNPLLSVVVASRDEVLVRFGIRSRFSHVLLDESRTGTIGPVLRAFQRARASGTPLSDSLDGIEQEEVDEAIAFLLERDVLVQAGRDPARMELDLLFDRPAVEDRVFLLGDGAHAAEVRRQLDRLPLGDLEPLPEAALASGDAGVGAALQRLAAVDDAIVVVALDSFRPSMLHRVNEVMLGLGQRWLLSVVDGPLSIVGPVFEPHEGPCYAEFEIQIESTIALRDEYLMQKEQLVAEDDVRRSSCSPLASSMCAAWTATWLVHALHEAPGFNPAKALLLDYRELDLDWVEVLRLPRCPACNWAAPTYPRHLLL